MKNIVAGRTGERYRCFYGRGCSLTVKGFRPFSPIVNDIIKGTLFHLTIVQCTVVRIAFAT